MDATLIIIDSDEELTRAQELVAGLMASEDPADLARLTAQARLIEAYEQSRWPSRPTSPAGILDYLIDQYGLSRADLVPLLGTASRVSEILSGKSGFSLTMVRRLRAKFHIPADLLIHDDAELRRRGSGLGGHQAASVALSIAT